MALGPLFRNVGVASTTGCFACRLQQGLQHALAGNAEYVRQYAAQLDVSVLQRLLYAVPLAGGIAQWLTLNEARFVYSDAPFWLRTTGRSTEVNSPCTG